MNWSAPNFGTSETSPGSTPTLSGATLDVATGPRTGGTRVVVTGATGIDVGASCTLGGVAHPLEWISSTSFAFVTRSVAYNATGAKDLVVTNPNLEDATKSSAYTYTGEGQASFTTWATFLTALDEAAEGFTAILTSTGGQVAKATVNAGDASYSFVGWMDLRKASTALLTEMFTEITGQAPIPQTPHASTGGLVIGVATNTQASIGLNSVSFIGVDRGIEAEFVWDTLDGASIANGGGFCAGFRARGVANTSTTLRGGGLTKSTTDVYRSNYCFDSLEGFSNSTGVVISAGSVVSGTVITTFYKCNRNGNVSGGSGNGVDFGGCRSPAQTSGTAVAAVNNSVVHTDRTDLQPVFCNFGLDGTNVLRLIRCRIFGDFVKV